MLVGMKRKNLEKRSKMRIKTIENISEEAVQLDLEDGSKLTLAPKNTFKNLRVKNVPNIKDKVRVVSDLGEINENHSGPVKLYD